MEFVDYVFRGLLAGLALGISMLVALLFAIFYQVAIKPDLQAWRQRRLPKASRAQRVQSA